MGVPLVICDHLPGATAPAGGAMSQAMRVLSLPACPGAAGHSEEGVAPLLYQSPPQKQRHTSGDPRGLEQAREPQGGNSIFCRTFKPRVYGAGGVVEEKKGSYALRLKPSPPLW